MNDRERVARAERAKIYRDEFLAPIIIDLKASYQGRIVEIATTELNERKRTEQITALSFALKLVDNISTHLDAAVADGKVAENSILKAERLEKMSPHQRRLLGIVPV